MYGLYAFNLDEATLQSRFIKPYVEGRTIVIEGTPVEPKKIQAIRVTCGSQAIQVAANSGARRKHNLWSAEQEVTDDYVLIGPGSGPSTTEPTPEKAQTAVERVDEICRRFHRAATMLRNRRSGRPPLAMDDEYDVQYLLHALLVCQFDDVRSEEWTPSYAGGASRMDFVLHAEEVVVEAKRTRSTLRDREIGEQLIVDIAKYATYPRCKELVCFVYDPEHQIANPASLESDLARGSNPAVRVIVTPRM